MRQQQQLAHTQAGSNSASAAPAAKSPNDVCNSSLASCRSVSLIIIKFLIRNRMRKRDPPPLWEIHACLNVHGAAHTSAAIINNDGRLLFIIAAAAAAPQAGVNN
jgi:hypothetical protein